MSKTSVWEFRRTFTSAQHIAHRFLCSPVPTNEGGVSQAATKRVRFRCRLAMQLVRGSREFGDLSGGWSCRSAVWAPFQRPWQSPATRRSGTTKSELETISSYAWAVYWKSRLPTRHFLVRHVHFPWILRVDERRRYARGSSKTKALRAPLAKGLPVWGTED